MPAPATRQYGVVDLMGRSAGFTGAGAMNYKEDRQGSVGTFTYSTQGNILTSQLVIDQTEAGFRAGGCDLAERLMRALEAGAQNGEGDTRCTGPKQIPSDSAALQVDLPGQAAGGYLRISVRGTGTTNPLVPLRTMFDTWRATHPCPGGVPDGGAGGAGGGGPGGRGGGGPGGWGRGRSGRAGRDGTGGEADRWRSGPGGGRSAAGTGGGSAAGTGGGSGAVDAGDDGTPGSDADPGCGCRVGASANDAIAAVLLIGMLLALRLRSSRRCRRGRNPAVISGAGITLLGLVTLGAATEGSGSAVIPIRVEFSAPARCSDVDVFYSGVLARVSRARRAEAKETGVRFKVRLTRVGNRIQGELRVIDSRGRADTRKVAGASCDEVVEVLSLTAALALDSVQASVATRASSASPPRFECRRLCRGGRTSDVLDPCRGRRRRPPPRRRPRPRPLRPRPLRRNRRRPRRLPSRRHRSPRRRLKPPA